ncbi:MAG TPA: outer membrane beta-barrel protein, partial [Chitinophagaceae bacterium]|nr:outer membrane beta-barrel protein [Chitinophagaceae bacterium]
THWNKNKIGNSVIQNTGTTPTVVDGIVLIPGAQYTKPINLNGAMNIFGFINYGFPIKKPKSNLNFSTTMSYIKDVNLYNQTKNYTHNYIIGERVNYNMNVKEVFDVNFASSSSYTFARYTLNNEQNGDYFTQTFSIEPTYSSKSGWIIGSDFDLTINRGQSVGYNQTIPLWNASIAKTIFKNKSGEIKFSVFDLLNQNKSINRTVEQNYIQDTRTQVLTRYFMLSFTYNLRKFAGKGQQMPPFMRGMMRNAQPRMMRMH